MGNSDALSKALLEWVNTFGLARRVEGWKDLLDGAIIWQVLQDIDPDYFNGSLPEPDAGASGNWIPKWTNCMGCDNGKS